MTKKKKASIFIPVFTAVAFTLAMCWRLRRADIAHRTSVSHVRVRMISRAIAMYYATHKEYPGKDLVQCLTGYRDDDNHPGYGYRLLPGGRVYGPWNGTERIPTNGEPRHFVDGFGKEIEYHPFKDMTDYMRASDSGANAIYYRSDYVVRSRGPDRRWDNPREPSSDDITNLFRPEE